MFLVGILFGFLHTWFRWVTGAAEITASAWKLFRYEIAWLEPNNHLK
jgi:hypothetical protein